jgi:hypothetical protein
VIAALSTLGSTIIVSIARYTSESLIIFLPPVLYHTLVLAYPLGGDDGRKNATRLEAFLRTLALKSMRFVANQ